MAQTEQQRVAPVRTGRWTTVGSISGLVGSIVLGTIAIVFHTGLQLTEGQFALVNQLGVVAVVLMAPALSVLYLGERHWFGSLARIGYGVMAGGWVVTAVSLAVFVTGSEVAGLVFPLGVLLTMIGALVFGFTMVRSDDTDAPRLGSWLLIAALPVGLPVSIAYTWYVLGSIDGPWNGPLLVYALAWMVFSVHLWGKRTASTEATVDEAV